MDVSFSNTTFASPLSHTKPEKRKGKQQQRREDGEERKQLAAAMLRFEAKRARKDRNKITSYGYGRCA